MYAPLTCNEPNFIIQFIDGSNGLITRKLRELRRKGVNPAHANAYLTSRCSWLTSMSTMRVAMAVR